MNEPVTRQLLSGKLDGGANQLAHISLVDGRNNTYVGLSSGASRPLAGGNNTYIGGFSGANATADATVLIGTRAGRVGKSIREGIFIGFRAGEFAERVDSSVCIGPYAGQKMKRANNNCVVGYKAGAELTSGSRNTALGAYASFQQFNGTDNVCIGFRSGYKNRIGANNCYVGSNSGFSAVSGFENVCLGVGSGQFLTAGTKNVLCGFLAGNAISNASNCIAIGTRAMEFFDSGDTNTCLGTETARRLSGNNNTILGGYTASNAAGSFNTVVGSRSMNRTNNWKVDLENSVIVGENVRFNIPINVIGLTYEDATVPVPVDATTIELGTLTITNKIVAPSRASADQYGRSTAVSADGTYVVVGAPSASGSGGAYVYVKSGTAWELQQKLSAPAISGGAMGYTASISADGGYVVLGAYNSQGYASGQGAVYIWARTESAWTLQATLVASVPAANDLFGYSAVGISGLGDAVVAGARGHSTNATGAASLAGAGAVFVYARTNAAWTLQQKLVPLDRAAGDDFGASTSVSNDGTVAIVGAPLNATNAAGGASLAGAGAVYIFAKSAGVWSQTQKIVAADRAAGDRFGASVSISGNGLYAIVGSHMNKTDANGTATLVQAGAVYIFSRPIGGTIWTQQAKVVAFDRATDDFLGSAVSISGDGRYALAGAYGSDTNATGGATLALAGAVYLLSRDGASWSQRKLVATTRVAGDEFGRDAVSMSGDSGVVAIGAYLQDTDSNGGNAISSAGAAYVFFDSGQGVTRLVDITLDTGLVGTEDITSFMQSTLVSPISTPIIGSAHRKKLEFRVDTAPTFDTLAPYERYLAFGFANESIDAWTTGVKAKAGPLTVRVGTVKDSVPNPPNGVYRLRWNHNTTEFPEVAYQDPSRYDLYVEPGPSTGMRAVTHTIDGNLVPINGAFLAAISAVGDGRSLANGGTIVTVTTAVPHGLASGAIVALGSIANPVTTAGVTGIWTVTDATATTLTFATAGDGATIVNLGTAALYACPRFVYTGAHVVFVRLQIDGRTAIAFTIPKPLEYGYLDFVVEQTNRAYGSTYPELNLKVRHAPTREIREVASVLAPVWNQTSQLGTFAISTAISVQLTATSEIALVYTALTKPSWLTVSSTGLLTGTASWNAIGETTTTSQTNAIQVRATDAQGQFADSPMLSLDVTSVVPTWQTATSLGSLRTNTPFTFPLSATSDSAISYYSVFSSPGFGTISGSTLSGTTPGSAGARSWGINAVDQETQTASRSFSLTVTAPSIHVSSYTLYPYFASDAGTSNQVNPGQWYIEGSNNGGTWTQLDYRNITWADWYARSFSCSNPGTYTYIRMRIVNASNASFNIFVGEIRYSGNNGEVPPSAMTGSVTAMTGGTYTASGPTGQNSTFPWQCFDKVNNGGYTGSSTGPITLQLQIS